MIQSSLILNAFVKKTFSKDAIKSVVMNNETINTRRSVEIKDLKGIKDTKRNHLDRDINLKLLLQASYASDTIP